MTCKRGLTTCILADLQGKAKNVEQKKESLITAMRPLVEDSNDKPNTTFEDNNDKTSKQSGHMILLMAQDRQKSFKSEYPSD